MITGVESSTPVIWFSTPEGAHAESYALQGRPFDSELEPSVAMSTRPVPLLDWRWRIADEPLCM